MYGLLLQSAIEIIRAKYGQETWEAIKGKLHLNVNSFSAFQQYGETLFVRIARILSELRSKFLYFSSIRCNRAVFPKRKILLNQVDQTR